MVDGKILFCLVVSGFLISGTLSVSAVTISSEKAILYVDDDFDEQTSGWGVTHFASIQDAVDAAVSGDGIQVFAGMYHELVTVDIDAIRILGEGSDVVTIFSMDSSNPVICIDSNQVVFSGCKISSGNGTHILGSEEITIHDVLVEGSNHSGVLVNQSSNILFTNMHIENCGVDGIKVQESCQQIVIRNSNVSSCTDDGVDIRGSSEIEIRDTSIDGCDDGFYLIECSGLTVIGNTLDGCGDDGIYVRGCDGATVRNNMVSECEDDGIEIDRVEGGTIRENQIHACAEDGLSVDVSSLMVVSGNELMGNQYGLSMRGTTMSLFYDNYFDNTVNVFFDCDVEENTWYIERTAGFNIVGGPFLGGNYWSDYNGTDTDGDLLGDTPYVLPDGSKDEYPLMLDRYPRAVTGGPYSGGVDDVIVFDGSGSWDPDGTIIQWRWDFGDGTILFGETVNYSFSQVGEYEVTLNVTDNEGLTDEKGTIANIGGGLPLLEISSVSGGFLRVKVTFSNTGEATAVGSSWEMRCSAPILFVPGVYAGDLDPIYIEDEVVVSSGPLFGFGPLSVQFEVDEPQYGHGDSCEEQLFLAFFLIF